MSSIPDQLAASGLAQLSPDYQLKLAQQRAETQRTQAATAQTNAETAITPQKGELYNQQAQGADLANQQARLALQDQETQKQAMMDSGGDPDVYLKLLGKRGVQPKTMADAQQTIFQTRRNYLTLNKEQREDIQARHDAFRGGLESIQAAPPEQKQAAWDNARQQVAQLDPEDANAMPAQYPGDDWVTLHHNGAGMSGSILKETQDRATAAEKLQKVESEKRAQAFQDLSAGVTDQSSYDQWRQQYPEEAKRAPERYFPDWVAGQVRRAVPIEKQPDYDIKTTEATGLKSLTDEDWNKRLDSTVTDKNSPLYKRTLAQVNFERQRGNFKAADDAIKAAGEQLGKTETAVATAKQTAPIKISVASATDAAKNPTAEFEKIINTTGAGRKYISEADLGKNRQAKAQALNAGIPVVDAATDDTLKQLDNARENLDYMDSRISKKLASDPTGRLFTAPGNTIEKLAQTDADLAAVGTYRTAAIQGLRAVAGSKGLRINRAEIEQAQENDIPKITDTLPVAKQKIANMKAFMDNVEAVHLTRDRSKGNTNPSQQGGTLPPTGIKTADDYLKKLQGQK